MPTRRGFLVAVAGLSATLIRRPGLAALLSPSTMPTSSTLELTPDHLHGKLTKDPAPPILPGGQWFIATAIDDGIHYRFAPGTLTSSSFLTFDFLLDDFFLAVFQLQLQEGEKGPQLAFAFGGLGQCQARLSMPLTAASQNRWLFDRQGELLKPMCWGDRVDLARVDRLRFRVDRKVESPIRFCMTPLRMVTDEPPLLDKPLLPKGQLCDEMGQSTLRSWQGKSASTDEVTTRLKSQLAAAPAAKWPNSFSEFGGDAKTFLGPPTGFFRTHHDGKRWWLVDPDGHPFWSTGVDCVGADVSTNVAGIESALKWLPTSDGTYNAAVNGGRHRGTHHIDFLVANLIRPFGPKEYLHHWGTIALSHLKAFGFNTIGNWSLWQLAKAAGFPYVRPLEFRLQKTPTVYRDFPDVFADNFAHEAINTAQQLIETASDPAMIGYFLMNEPNWGFSNETPAAGMLFNTETCACRDALAEHLKNKYHTDADLSAAWKMQITYAQITKGRLTTPLTPSAKEDLSNFSTVMVDRLFTVLTDACRKIDPNHLNLGARYFTIPPDWALAGMKRFDIFSFNCYREQVPPDYLNHIEKVVGRPTLIGEWHFGALDAGLPASGIGRVKDQAARGQAFRIYVEQAAALPNCVGVHYFTLYDEPALGRFDGENYNIGFLDITNRPYEPLAAAARQTHDQLYQVAAGEVLPYADAPEYLFKIFC